MLFCGRRRLAEGFAHDNDCVMVEVKMEAPDVVVVPDSPAVPIIAAPAPSAEQECATPVQPAKPFFPR